jgi:hypothetical protein
MKRTDVEELAVKLGMLAAGLKELGERLIRQTEQAQAELTTTAKTLACTAEASARTATTDLMSHAGKAILASTEGAAADLERAMGDAASTVTRAGTGLESKINELRRLHALSVWKALFATGGALVAITGAAGVAGWHTYAARVDAAWADELHEAGLKGTLRRCPEGGVCVYVNKRWHRLAR